MDLWSDVTRRQPWSSAASSWPARPESDVGTGPGACSHTACRTSWCRRYCSPDMRERGEVSINAQAASNIWTWYTRSHPVYFLLSIGGAGWIDLYGHRRSEDHYMVHGTHVWHTIKEGIWGDHHRCMLTYKVTWCQVDNWYMRACSLNDDEAPWLLFLCPRIQ